MGYMGYMNYDSYPEETYQNGQEPNVMVTVNDDDIRMTATSNDKVNEMRLKFMDTFKYAIVQSDK